MIETKPGALKGARRFIILPTIRQQSGEAITERI